MKNYLLIALMFVVSISCNSQEKYSLKYGNKTTIKIIKIESSDVTDSISVYPRSLNKQHSYVKIYKGNIVMRSHLIIPAIANFKGSYILIEKWIIDNGKFKLSDKVKIIPNGCDLKKLSFKLVETGIEWKVKKGIFKKRLKGFISFDDYLDKDYIIDNKKTY